MLGLNGLGIAHSCLLRAFYVLEISFTAGTLHIERQNKTLREAGTIHWQKWLSNCASIKFKCLTLNEFSFIHSQNNTESRTTTATATTKIWMKISWHKLQENCCYWKKNYGIAAANECVDDGDGIRCHFKLIWLKINNWIQIGNFKLKMHNEQCVLSEILCSLAWMRNI